MKWKVSNNERPIKEGFYYTVDSIGCKSVTEFARNHWYSSTGHPVVEWLDESPSGSEAWVSVELQSQLLQAQKENEELKENWKMTEENYQDDAIKWINERAKLEKEVEYWKARCEAAEDVIGVERTRASAERLGDRSGIEAAYGKWQALKQPPIK